MSQESNNDKPITPALIKQYIKKRATYKGIIKRINTFFEHFNIEDGDYSLLETKFNNLIENWDKYNDMQIFLEANDEITDHLADRIDTEDIVDNLRSSMKRLLDLKNVKQEYTSNSSFDNTSMPFVLPQFNLPKFTGSYDDWLSFSEIFKASIHNNRQLSPVQKFHYLMSCVGGPAHQLIKNLSLTPENYDVAWNLLETRYANKRLIAVKHAKEIIYIPSIQRESAHHLVNFINILSSNISAIKTLNIDMHYAELILVQLLIQRLDQTTAKAYEMTLIDNVCPSMDNFINFLEKRRQVLENTNSIDVKHNKQSFSNKQEKLSQNVHVHTITTKQECLCCKQQHFLYKCIKFIKSNVNDRQYFVKKHNLCFNCLSSGHQAKTCTNVHKCKICNYNHHTLLHIDSPSKDKYTADKKSEVTSSANYCALKAQCVSSKILLATAMVKVDDIHSRPQPCRVLLDAGSQANFITERMAQFLNLKRVANELPITGINNVASKAKFSVTVKIYSNYENYATTLTCFVLPSITSDMPVTTFDTSSLELPINVQLADENFNITGRVDLLIGAELYLHLLKKGQVSMGENYPALQETRLGWILSGKLPLQVTNEQHPVTSLFVQGSISVQQQLQKFWELEEINTTPCTKEERDCERHFTENFQRDTDGRFIVRLPKRSDSSSLGDSLNNAERRFHLLEKRLKRNSNFQCEYSKFMDEYLLLNHMQHIPHSLAMNSVSQSYYLPHHAVFKENSTTTKLRVVFDASTKSMSGVSLNDILMVGPTIQQDLVSILLRFRTHIYAMTADITKMYRQIRVHPEDQDLQRILWRHSPTEDISHYKLATVTYGTAPASFLATRCLLQLANDNSKEYPRASEIISRDFYVDDLLTGSDHLETARCLQDEIISILSQACFSLHKWCSNDSSLISSVPEEKREIQSLYSFKSGSIRTLGIVWDFNNDVLRFGINLKPIKGRFTKRNVLSIIASIYDPLGLLGPVVMLFKMFMQNLWHYELNWDDSLPVNLLSEWLELHKSIPVLKAISIPRLAKIKGHIVDIQVHGFCDASEGGYGACLYLRTGNDKGEIAVNLLCSKSRVSPVKKISLPRLELCGALLLARLTQRVLPVLCLHVNSIHLWTDSTIVISWITAAPTRWKTFVANRVAEIQTITNDCKWKHVRSEQNPADVLSRGINPHCLQQHPLWWNGPSWLKESESTWPMPISSLSESLSKLCLAELKNQTASLVVLQPATDITERFSSLPRMMKVLSYCRRFIHNTRKQNVRLLSNLTVEEVNGTLLCCIRQIQKIHFHSELAELQSAATVSKKSKLYTLYPFIDSHGCLRVGGRLQLSDLDYDQKHPLILPAKSHLTTLLIRNEHERQMHASLQLLHASLRQKYWIINAKNTIRLIVRKCIICFRLKGKESQQLMGQLPKERIQPSQPFLNCGIDYAGPLTIRQGGRRSKATVKCYIALFICLATKAVHIELVSDLTTEAFIASLRRFVSRRGLCANIYSDNGSNFVGANNVLKNLYNFIKNEDFQKRITSYSLNERIQWHFIPPNSPHFGGLWEAGVKSLKYHLRRIVGNLILNFEEMTTVLAQIEACLNSRPLCTISTDSSDPQVLTPGHFLVGHPLTSLPDHNYYDIPLNRLNRWQLVQRCVQQLWSKWSSDYLHQLQQRFKWCTKRPDLQPDSVVLLKDDKTPPLQWKLGVVKEVHRGPDDLVRVATIKTSNGLIKRAINKLCKLPIND